MILWDGETIERIELLICWVGLRSHKPRPGGGTIDDHGQVTPEDHRRAAEKGAEIAAPLIADTIRNMSIADAAAIINGGPRAATSLLQNELGATLANRMLPGIGQGLELFDNEIINLVLSQVTNIDFAGIRGDVTNKASDAIYKAIGAQEEAIRANPQATNDPLLIAIFGLS